MVLKRNQIEDALVLDCEQAVERGLTLVCHFFGDPGESCCAISARGGGGALAGQERARELGINLIDFYEGFDLAIGAKGKDAELGRRVRLRVRHLMEKEKDR